MNEIGEAIKELRKKKGLSQEELAEASKVNLRTIQRIERNKSEPRGTTLNLICCALGITTEDILDYGKQMDKNYLIYFHLSVLTFLVIPTGNLILPMILWLTKKDKIIGLKEIGINLLNFQIVWTFVTFLVLTIGALFKILHWRFGSGYPLFIFWGTSYSINIIIPIFNAIKTKNGKDKILYPNIIRIIK